MYPNICYNICRLNLNFLCHFTATFSIEKVEAQCLGSNCNYGPCPKGCICQPTKYPHVGLCFPGPWYKDVDKIVGENFMCQDGTGCKTRKLGNKK
jgi:hypothetical protein